LKYYLLYNDKIGQYLKNPKAGYWSTTDKTEAEEMHKVATTYFKSCGYKFLEGKIRILEVPKDFDPENDPVPNNEDNLQGHV
jgi:hypothetical protein